MTLKHKIPLALKSVSVLLCMAALAYWTYVATEKYIKQPTSTYFSYTRGDDDAKIVFPHLTFCPYQFVEYDAHLKTCSGNQTEFVPAIYNCLKNDPLFNVHDYLQNITINLKDFIYWANLVINHKKVMDLGDYFYIKYHSSYGQCIGFDSERMNIEVQDKTIKLYMHFKKEVLSKTWIIVSLHTEYDFPDAFSIHPMIWLESAKLTQLDINIKKTFVTREPTYSSPCGELNVNTCQDIVGHQRIIEKLGCKVPFLYTGKHLEKYVREYHSVADCETTQDMLKALEQFIAKDDEHCPRTKPCSTTKIDMAVDRFQIQDDTLCTLAIAFSNLEVEHITTYISYDLQNLICELGGLLGMTLGFSGVSLAFYFADSIRIFF